MQSILKGVGKVYFVYSILTCSIFITQNSLNTNIATVGHTLTFMFITNDQFTAFCNGIFCNHSWQNRRRRRVWRSVIVGQNVCNTSLVISLSSLAWFTSYHYWLPYWDQVAVKNVISDFFKEEDMCSSWVQLSWSVRSNNTNKSIYPVQSLVQRGYPECIQIYTGTVHMWHEPCKS